MLSEKEQEAREKLSQSLNGKRKLETEEFAKIVNVLNVSAKPQ